MKLTSCGTSRILAATCSIFMTLAGSPSMAQTASAKPWSVLENGVQAKGESERVAAVRVLGLIHEDPHAAELAEKALTDANTPVRVAAATALGQMHATGADAALKHALNDKQLSVVMAAAHALRQLNDPVCYEIFYAVLTGERKGDSMIDEEMKILRDPKQVAAMGFDEGIGFVPFASMGWDAVQTIMKDQKSGTAAKAALISSLSTDPDPRVDQVLIKETKSPKWVLRVAALEAIAKRGKPALVPDIENALDESKYEVKYTAAATIVYLNELGETHKASAEFAPTPPRPDRGY